jgi:endonuclease-3
MSSIKSKITKKTAKANAVSKRKAEQGAAAITPAEAEEMFSRLAAARPDPETELDHTNPFTLLVAVVLSAQATDAGVNKATHGLFRLADSPAKMAALGEERLRDMIKTIGLYRNKAKNVIALAEQLVREHGGEVPRDRASLEALPGVGRKSANVVLNVAFGEPVIAVDTHIFRVANRTGLASGETPLEVERGLGAAVPPVSAQRTLADLHRYVCKSRKPALAPRLRNGAVSSQKQSHRIERGNHGG